MRKIVFVILVLSILFLIPIGYAQFGNGGNPVFYFSDCKPVVGGWSEYQLTHKGEQPSKVKIAIVGREGDAYWYETLREGIREGRVIGKKLASGNPEEQESIRRFILKMGDEPAIEMPMQSHKFPEQKG